MNGDTIRQIVKSGDFLLGSLVQFKSGLCDGTWNVQHMLLNGQHEEPNPQLPHDALTFVLNSPKNPNTLIITTPGELTLVSQ